MTNTLCRSASRSPSRALLVVLALAFASSAVAQSRFIWTDENGRKVYSDNPPPASVPRAKIQKGADQIGKALPPAVPAPTVAAPGKKDEKAKAPMTLAERDAASKKAAKDSADKAKQQEADDNKIRASAERCAQLEAYQNSLESGGRITRPNAQGQNEFLDDSGRAAELTKTRTALRECR